MKFHQTRCFVLLFELLFLAGIILADGEVLYKASVLELEPSLPSVQSAGGPDLPIQLTPDEIKSIECNVAGTTKDMELLNDLKE
ncbi:unnamed protein product [Penicillium camemberti]|uniref:Str. FM013 n=1 Tax=Penicillium camemberti (strain FM 013) TaxID=1429867 RepID=A0A0G4PC20_PENC3|nr:unnamed protein product [Penicillium camemberti]